MFMLGATSYNPRIQFQLPFVMTEPRYPFPPPSSAYWKGPDALMSYDEAVRRFNAQSDKEKEMMCNPVQSANKPSPTRTGHPLPPPSSIYWKSSNTTYDKAVADYQKKHNIQPSHSSDEGAASSGNSSNPPQSQANGNEGASKDSANNGSTSHTHDDSSHHQNGHTDSESNGAQAASPMPEPSPPTLLKSELLCHSETLNHLAKTRSGVYRAGTKGSAVKLIQQVLQKLAFDLKANGYFDETTKQHVQQFQKAYTPSHTTHPSYTMGGADGVVGRKTLFALDEALLDSWRYSSSRAQDFKFTLRMLQKVYPLVKSSKKVQLQQIADELNDHIKFYKLDTPNRRYHFFAQIMQETGARLQVEEYFRYSYKGSIYTFSAFSKNQELARKYCYDDAVSGKNTKYNGEPLTQDDFIHVANIAYGGRMGNTSQNDGWKFRGKGLKPGLPHEHFLNKKGSS